MSIALSTLRSRIRTQLRDTDPGRPAFLEYELDNAISRVYQALGGRLQMPLEWNTSFVTLGPDDYEYEVNFAYDVHSIALYKLRSTGALIQPVNSLHMERMRDNIVGVGGDPILINVEEKASSAGDNRRLNVRVYPTPAEADYIDVLIAKFPLNLTTDSDSIELSDLGAIALQYGVCAELVEAMVPEELERLQLNPSVGRIWAARASQAEDDEYVRVARLRRGNLMNKSAR